MASRTFAQAKRNAERNRARYHQGKGKSVGGIQAEGLNELLADVSTMISRTEDFAPLWPEIGRVWVEREQEVFATRSKSRWARLAASTIRSKRRAGVAGKPDLVRTGALLAALTQVKPRSSGSRFVVFGPPPGSPATKYGTDHAKGRGSPQRDPVPKLTPNERKRMVTDFGQYLSAGIRGMGE